MTGISVSQEADTKFNFTLKILYVGTEYSFEQLH
jgi:hypothetical protein